MVLVSIKGHDQGRRSPFFEYAALGGAIPRLDTSQASDPPLYYNLGLLGYSRTCVSFPSCTTVCISMKGYSCPLASILSDYIDLPSVGFEASRISPSDLWSLVLRSNHPAIPPELYSIITMAWARLCNQHLATIINNTLCLSQTDLV